MLTTIRHPALTASALPPLLIVHGLYGSARNWNVIAKRMSEQRDVLAVDMRNHGESPWFPTHSYPDMAADLAEVIRAHGGLADVMGHSMGGKASMMLALTEPALLRRLVVADIAPVAYDHDQTQYITAMRAMDLTHLSTRAEADRRLAATVPEAPLRAFFLQSLDLKAEGGPRWRLNLDVLQAEMPKIVGWPAPQGQFNGPTLFLAGSESTYIRPEYRARIRPLFPNARFAKLPGAGHWLHADKPREFEQTLRIFLDT
ncbi:Pimeloyl-ACP methyl ester carboxylesterase [Gemmobacter aquatilis]|uniref:Pimeloyl-ACP methyl ester carboxylesterase n=1 Tax=Gemmobacter aquatilis TaxID=933059 RepID=A0A1H8I0D0_9RHOB|nr:alpha/beta fold hydrolase [Gemmobacter aquatilis]SEN61822.1 Pimeloyl-ACP methyl ester carboxylesterase [Gemmobacter aquatilis]